MNGERPIHAEIVIQLAETTVERAEALQRKLRTLLDARLGDEIGGVEVREVPPPAPPERTSAEHLLIFLMWEGDPVLASNVKRLAKHYGIPDAALRKAKDKLGIRSKRLKGGFGSKGGWYWAYEEWFHSTDRAEPADPPVPKPEARRGRVLGGIEPPGGE
jgi:hypothetical protein